MANEGLGWDPLLKMVHNPGGHCYREGGQPNLWVVAAIFPWFLSEFRHPGKTRFPAPSCIALVGGFSPPI